jgi:hypothetical protein
MELLGIWEIGRIRNSDHIKSNVLKLLWEACSPSVTLTYIKWSQKIRMLFMLMRCRSRHRKYSTFHVRISSSDCRNNRYEKRGIEFFKKWTILIFSLCGCETWSLTIRYKTYIKVSWENTAEKKDEPKREWHEAGESFVRSFVKLITLWSIGEMMNQYRLVIG